MPDTPGRFSIPMVPLLTNQAKQFRSPTPHQVPHQATHRWEPLQQRMGRVPVLGRPMKHVQPGVEAKSPGELPLPLPRPEQDQPAQTWQRPFLTLRRFVKDTPEAVIQTVDLIDRPESNGCSPSVALEEAALLYKFSIAAKSEATITCRKRAKRAPRHASARDSTGQQLVGTR